MESALQQAVSLPSSPQAGQPAPLAEQDRAWMKLPGIDSFVSEVRTEFLNGREKDAIAAVVTWDIIRRCYEYGEREDVRARVAALNKKPDGSTKEGRPYEGHRLAMQAIAEKCNVRLNTVERWQRDYRTAVKYGGLDPCELNLMIGFNPPQLVERLYSIYDQRDAKGAARRRARGRPQLTPEDLGAKLARRLVRQAGLEKGRDDGIMRGILLVLTPLLVRHSFKVQPV